MVAERALSPYTLASSFVASLSPSTKALSMSLATRTLPITSPPSNIGADACTLTTGATTPSLVMVPLASSPSSALCTKGLFDNDPPVFSGSSALVTISPVDEVIIMEASLFASSVDVAL